MELKANFEIHGLSNVLTGTRKAEGIANPGDLYEVDNATAKVHIKEGYGVDPTDPDVQTDVRSTGPQIIKGELEKGNDELSLSDIALPAAKPGASATGAAAKPKRSGGKKAAAAAAPVVAEPTTVGPAEPATSEETDEDDIDDLGLDDDSDSVE